MPNNLYYLVNHTLSQNDNRIRFQEIQVNLTQNRFDHYIETLRHNNKMVERKISDYASDLTLFGFLNLTNQNCVVKYAQIPDVDKFKLSINTCANSAAYAFTSVFLQAKNMLTNAKSYNIGIRSGSETCYGNNKSDAQRLAKCIDNRVRFNFLLTTFFFIL